MLTTSTGHNSAFDALYEGLKDPSILLNGAGNVTRFNNTLAKLEPPPPYTLVFQKQTPGSPRKYLLRLINTSFSTIFVFSIDNHYLTVVGADFVPIWPYRKTSVLIGIGQRYEVIVEAKPDNNASQPIPPDYNFWIRTYVANCGPPLNLAANYSQTGILRYNDKSTTLPSSKPWNGVSKACSDETYDSLRPVLKWKVGNPANAGQEQDVVLNTKQPKPYPVAAFSLEPTTFNSSFIPLRIDYGDPTFLHLNNTKPWNPKWVIVPENYSATDWVCILSQSSFAKLFLPGT